MYDIVQVVLIVIGVIFLIKGIVSLAKGYNIVKLLTIFINIVLPKTNVEKRK